MTKITEILASLPPLSDDERVQLIRQLAKPLSWSFAFDDIDNALDRVSQDITDNDAAANRHWAGGF